MFGSTGGNEEGKHKLLQHHHCTDYLTVMVDSFYRNFLHWGLYFKPNYLQNTTVDILYKSLIGSLKLFALFCSNNLNRKVVIDKVFACVTQSHINWSEYARTSNLSIKENISIKMTECSPLLLPPSSSLQLSSHQFPCISTYSHVFQTWSVDSVYYNDLLSLNLFKHPKK